MSELVIASPKPKSTLSSSADKEVFAQIEKWMAVIRELSREDEEKPNRS
jgi:hypothetical protein